MADKFGLLEKLERYGIDKIMRLLAAPKGLGRSAGTAIGAGFGGPLGAMIGGTAGNSLDALRNLLSPQQPMMADVGYNPLENMQSPLMGQMQQGPMNDFMMGGAQGLGNFAGQQLGQGGINALSLLGQGDSSNFGGGDFLKKLLEMIPEKDIHEYLASLQQRRG